METLQTIFTQLSGLAAWQILLIGSIILVIWFLPAMLAVVFNPPHAKYIAFACIPAGLSLIAWSGLIIWAVTEKVFEKYKDKVEPVQGYK